MCAFCHVYVVKLSLTYTLFSYPSYLPVFSNFPDFIFSSSAVINVFQVS